MIAQSERDNQPCSNRVDQREIYDKIWVRFPASPPKQNMKKIKAIFGFVVFLYGCFFLLFTEWQRLSGNDQRWLEDIGIAAGLIFMGFVVMFLADMEREKI